MRTLSDDIRALGVLLGDVLREQAGPAAFALVEELRQTIRDRRREGLDTGDVAKRFASLPADVLEVTVRAFSLYFLLTNLAEEHERVRRRRARDGSRKQTLDEAMQLLNARGMSADAVEELIRTAPLMLTFTAHPTEMRRRTVRGHLRSIADDVPQLEDDTARVRIAAHIEALWGTLELRGRSPTVHDEVKAGLHYVGVLANAMTDVERDLRESFARCFGRPLRAELPLSLHSWMGGDRDGNPHVTADVTRATLRLHRVEADRLVREALISLYENASQHRERTSGAPPVVGTDEEVLERGEPFRARLQQILRHQREEPEFDVAAALESVDETLQGAHQHRTREVFLTPVRCKARVLGRTLCALDVREHSARIGKAVALLVAHAGVPAYEQLSEADKCALLERELVTQRPFLIPGTARAPELDSVLRPLEVLREEGIQGTRYVVSMTNHVSDLLEVLILAREAGAHVLPTPLFETLDDLERAPSVVDALLDCAPYRALLGDEVQEIMLGYSDSNKDTGPIAAAFALHEAQRSIAERCRRRGVRWRFFHGRGTSLGRGGGPMARAILGQPAGTIGAGLRITEQGEALADKYGHPDLARRNLEQGLAAVLLAAAAPTDSPVPARWLEAWRVAARASRAAYRALVEDPGFRQFYEAVTPLEEIARLRIASRPVRRPGPVTLENLRAIPWVMAWSQTRANVPGWYGVEAALAALDVELAREMLEGWPAFRSTLENIQMALAKSDEVIFHAYLALDDAGSSLGPHILAARQDAIQRIEAVTRAPLLAHEPHLLRSITLRNPYIEPIHRAQIELLRRSRRDGRSAEMDRALLATILGIAAGVRSAG